jgi:4'-phosphopantetheinyl transferase EntD
MALVTALLASGLFGAETLDRGQPVDLPALEAVLVERAVAKRQREFALGRMCARSALEKLGHGSAVIGRGANGAPLWPQGITGSITHTKGYAAAVVGELRHFSGIGVDAERMGGVTQDLWPRLFDDTERDHLMDLDEPERDNAATLIFSAKEACYKAWGAREPLVFRDIRITPGEQSFTAARSGEILQGRYAVDGDLVVTAVWF